jgi:hypothetical protein
MSADTLDVRIARLEGAFEQLDKRLEVVERKIDAVDRKMDAGFAELRAEIRGVESGLRNKMDRQFFWLLGTLLLFGSYLVFLGLKIIPH